MTSQGEGLAPGADISKIDLHLGERSYSIHVGPGLVEQAGTLLAPLFKRPLTRIVTDENVARAVLPQLQESLAEEGFEAEAIVLPAGEATKSFEQLQALTETLLEAQLERDDLIVALGGGVIGDLTGFAASILKRGIGFVQVPTTLLAQVDSSVGGKTGINTRFGKNLIGSFHQPRAVLADVDTLGSLSQRDLRTGYAEVVKYGLINQPDFFSWLEKSGADLLAGSTDARQYAVAQSCRFKAGIVAEDEKEKGSRALLNLGHTFGHALEAETGYSSRLTHGEGVSIGMCLAFDFSVEQGLAKGQDAVRVKAHLESAGLPTKIKDIPGEPMTADALLHHMYQDKKASGGKLTFILTRGIGQSFVDKDVDPSSLLSFLNTRV